LRLRSKMNKTSKIYIAGHRGMVGSAILRKLQAEGYENLVLRTSNELDLRKQQDVADFFATEKPAYVFLAAAKVGGIVANNTYRAEFLYDNLAIQSNVIHNSYLTGVKKLLFLGSSCIYPKLAPQPLKEEYLLTGELEPTNEPYAIAKIAGLKMCDAYRAQYGCNFISAMPTNLYGPNDNYNLETSHVLPALIRKMYLGKALENDDWEAIRKDINNYPLEGITGEATQKEILVALSKFGVKLLTSNAKLLTSITLWGDGSPKREFLHVDDLANACLFLMLNFDEPGFVNVGTGKDLSIKELAEMIKRIVGFQGELVWDTLKPNGTPRKLMDVSKMERLGWKYSISLQDGVNMVGDDYDNT
jgi:GDP-L-fucose synthase